MQVVFQFNGGRVTHIFPDGDREERTDLLSDILKNYGIDSETDVSVLDQDTFNNSTTL